MADVVGLIFAVAMFLSSIIFGISLSELFLSKSLKQKIYIIGSGIPIGFVISAYLMILLSVPSGRFNFLSIPVVAIIELVVSAIIIIKKKDGWLRSIREEFGKEKQIYVSIIAIALVLMLFQAQGIYSSKGAIWSGSNYATDFMFHIGIGTSVLFSSFPPRYLYLYNATNVFPFIGDFYTQALSYSGFGIIPSTYAVNFMLWFSLVAMLIMFFATLGKDKKAAAVAVIIFLFFSLALNFLIMWAFNISLPGFTLQTLHSITKRGTFSVITSMYYNFDAPFYNNLIIQHDLLFGFPLALLIITFVYLNFIDGEKKYKGGAGSMLFVGAIFGLLPLVNPFCFIFVFIFSAFAFFYSVFKWANHSEKDPRASLYSWMQYGASSFLIALPSILYIQFQHKASSFAALILKDGVWYSNGYSILASAAAHVSFWFWSIGILFPVGLIGIAYLPKKAKIAFIPALFTFLLMNIYRFQPSFGDNNKLTMFFSLFLAMGASVLILRLFKAKGTGLKRKAYGVAAISLFLLMVAGGVASTYYIFSGQGYIVSGIEQRAGAWIINNTSPNAVFESNCYNYTFDFLPTLAGRDTLLSIYVYSGTDGIVPKNYNPFIVMGQMGSFFQSKNPPSSLLQRYNVSYIVLERITGKNTMQACAPANFTAFEDSRNFTEIYNAVNQSDNDRIAVFKANFG